MAENKATPAQGEIIIYQTDDGKARLDVRFENETVWLTQAQMAELFQSSRTNIHGNEQLFASKYKLYLPTEEQLRAEIETQKKFFLIHNS